jgi:hypothetical protein
MRIEIICLSIILFIALFFSGIREGAQDKSGGEPDPNATPSPSPYRTPYQNALEAVAILQDKTITPDAQMILLKSRLKGNAYDEILSNNAMNPTDKIEKIKSILEKSAFQGQLTARIISLDQKLDTQTKLRMIQALGNPPPVYPNMFKGKISDDNILELIQIKTF